MPTYQALLHRFRVVCDDDLTETYLREILAPLAVDGSDHHDAVTEYHLTRNPGSATLDGLLIDGVPATSGTNTMAPVTRLLSRIDHDAERVTGASHTVLHAAACHLDGRTVLIPGAPDAGKSTLVAHLSRHGWTYLSDELVSIAPGSPPQILAYPRTIVLDPGSWALFDGHLIEPPPALVAHLPRRRHVAPPDASRAHPGEVRPATDVLLYRWRSGEEVRMETLDPVDALRALLGSSFSLQRNPQRDLDVLASLVERAGCWRVAGGKLVDVDAALREALFLDHTVPTHGDVR